MVTRDKAIKYFYDEIMYCRRAPALNGCEMREDWKKTIDVCEMAIATLREQEERRWISVTERLPDDCNSYIVVVKYKYDHEEEYNYDVDVATYYTYDNPDAYIDNHWDTYNDWYEGQQYIHITHWMPLPEPPKEVSE